MDRQFKKSALTIGVRMAALSGAMVLVGALFFSAALWRKVTRGPGEPEPVPSVTLTLDVVDLTVALRRWAFSRWRRRVGPRSSSAGR